MDVYLVVVRLIHIFAAMLWVGSGFYNIEILLPGLASMGADGDKVLVALSKNRLFGLIFPVSAMLTVIAGILLYLRPDGLAVFTSTGKASISIGALAGLAAAIHGGAFLGRSTGVYVTKLASGTADPAELKAIGANLLYHGRISLVLMIIAVIGMSLARYI